MKRLLLLLLFVAWLAGPSASHAQSPEALQALADLVIDSADKRVCTVQTFDICKSLCLTRAFSHP